MPDYPDYIVRQILQDAGNDWDFELFCTRHYTDIEGINYLPTSRSYDLGADGRVVRKRSQGESFIIASMQKEDIERKAMRDLHKLLSRVSRPAKVRLCFAFLKTEQQRREIEAAARKTYPSTEYEVTGIVQIVEEVHRHSAAFEGTYEAALGEVRRQRESVDRSPQPSMRLGLRVLLSTQLDQNAVALRRGILSGLVLQTTKRGIATTQSEILRSLAEAIGLHRQIEPSYIADTLRSLEKADYISIDQSGDVRRRELASDSMEHTADAAASRAIEGFGALRRSLSRHFDESISAADFRKIWRAVQDALVKLFQRYGTEFVEFVHALGDAEGSGLPRSIPESPLEGLRKVAQSIDVLELSLPEAKVQRLAHVLPDALLDAPSGARQWLAQLCLAYVCACSLGLHPDALKRMEMRLRSWDVMPDTHIILSALGRGEPDHADMAQLLRWWLNAGGKLMAIDPVLRETRRHANLGASIVKRWAEKCNHRRGRVRVRTAPPKNNVFLRSAVAIHGDELGPASAERYLRQFLGRGTDDLAGVRRILEADFGFHPGPSLVLDNLLVDDIYRVTAAVRLRDEYDYEDQAANARARCRHDAEALAYLAAYRESLKGTGRVAVILSHSTHLRNVHDQFHARLGFMSPCIDPARLMFAMSLSPGAAFTMASLQSTLFGTVFQKQVKRHEELARKVMDGFVQHDEDGDHTPALADMVDQRLTENVRRTSRARIAGAPENQWP
jgi:DNA-binding PadR family transcriptional regulator